MVQNHNGRIPPADFWRSEFQPLREAYAAGLFSWIRAQQQQLVVKLNRDRFPDFDLKSENSVVAFELVEAMEQGRRRADEYREAARRKAAGLPELIEHFDPAEEEQSAILAIERAVEKKAAKKYNPAPPLLVYVNLWIFDAPPLTPEP